MGTTEVLDTLKEPHSIRRIKELCSRVDNVVLDQHTLCDVQLGLFELGEHQNPATGLVLDEFMDSIICQRDASEQALWRSTTATRMQLQEFASFVNKQLDKHTAESRELRQVTASLHA